MLHAFKLPYRLGNTAGRNIVSTSGGRGGENVLEIVRAAKRNLVSAHDRLTAGDEIFSAQRLPAERPDGGPQRLRRRINLRIVRVQNRGVAGVLVFENTKLGCAIRRKVGVAIEM